MPTTSNFGWTTPADTDYVKDGALAIRTLGNGIDTSLIDLKGGTTGQVLSKASNTDLDYSWTTPNVGDITEVQAGTGISIASGTGPIPVVTSTVATTFDAKGDLVVGTGADTFSKLTVGTNGYVLTAASGETTGLKWAAASSGSVTFIKSVTVGSNVASVAVTSAFSATYDNYLIVVNGIDAATDESSLTLTFGAISSGYYGTRYFDRAIAGTTSTTRSNNASDLACAVMSTSNDSAITMYIYQPNATERTLFTSAFAAGQFGGYASGLTTSTTAVTDFTLACSSNMTGGTIRVYGLSNS